MAAIDITAVPAYVDEFSTSSDSWQVAAEIPASQLGASRKYLILVACGVDSDGDDDDEADGAVEVRVVHGSTEFSDSLAYLCPVEPTQAPKYYRNYGFMEVFTQPGTAEAIQLQVKRHAAGDDDHQVYVADISVVAIDINDLTENSDYYLDEDDDTGSPVEITLAELDTTDRTFAHYTGGEIGLYAVFIYTNWRMNNTTSAGQMHLEIQQSNGSLNKFPNVVRQTAKHEDERLAILFGAGVNVAWAVDSQFNTRVQEYGPSATKHEHMVTRVFFLKIYENDASPVGDVRNWASLTVHHPNFPVYDEPSQTGINAFTNSLETHFLFFAHTCVDSFLQPYEPTGYIFADATGTDLTGAEDVVLLPGFNHVIGYNVGAEDVTPQVRIGTKTYQSGTNYRPILARDGGDFLGSMNAGGASWIHIATSGITAYTSPTITLPQFEFSNVGTFTAPTNVGEAELELPQIEITASGEFGNFFSAVVSLELPQLSVEGEGEFEVAAYDDSVTFDMPQLELAATATFSVPVYTAAETITLPQITFEATAEFELPACEAFEYHEDGRSPISVNQELRYGLDYPLVEPSADIKDLIADFFLAYDDPNDYDSDAAEFEGPFHIAWFFGHGCLASTKPSFVQGGAYHDADIIIKDARGRIVFDSMDSDDYRSQDWADRLKIHEWRTDDAVCRVVVHTKWWDADGVPTPRNYEVHIAPDSAVLDDRTVVRMPKRLRSITVNSERLQGQPEIHSGYNTAVSNLGSIADPLTVPTAVPLAGVSDGGRNGYRIEISAEAGSGLGRYPGCENLELYIKTINNQPPDEYGNFRLSSQDCYWWEQPADRTNPKAVMTPATLQIHNDCVPCCSCDDYVQVKLGIDSVYRRWSRIATEALRIRDVYSANRDRWNEDVACRLENQNQRIVLSSNCAGFLGVGYSFCSQSDECEGELEVEFDFIINSAPGDRPPPDGSPIPEEDEDSGGGGGGDDEGDPTSFGPELVQNWNFAQAAANWTLRGAYSKLSNPDRYSLGESSSFNPASQLLLNDSFNGNTTNWTLTGNASYNAGSDYVQVGGGGGGVGRLFQTTALTDDGEVYRTIVFYGEAAGTTRVRVSDGNGVDIGVQALVAASQPNCTFCGEHILVTAAGGSTKVQVESEVAAVNYVRTKKVQLIPWSGSIRQVVTGLTAGASYRLQLVIDYNTSPMVVSILSADESETIFTQTLPAQTQPPFRTFTKDLQIDAASVTVVVSLSPDEFGGLGNVRSISLKRAVFGNGGVINPDDGEDENNPDSEETTTYDLNVRYVPNSARKNNVQSQRMKPYVMSGTFPHLSATWEKLNPGKAAKLTFICYACNAIDGDSVTVVATPTFRGERLASVSDTIAITPECPSEQELCSDN